MEASMSADNMARNSQMIDVDGPAIQMPGTSTPFQAKEP
jgi:hypothetical protein